MEEADHDRRGQTAGRGARLAARRAAAPPFRSPHHAPLTAPPCSRAQFKRLPLHIAEEKGTSPENIELLLATYPDAINVKDPLKGLV